MDGSAAADLQVGYLGVVEVRFGGDGDLWHGDLGAGLQTVGDDGTGYAEVILGQNLSGEDGIALDGQRLA